MQFMQYLGYFKEQVTVEFHKYLFSLLKIKIQLQLFPAKY